MTTMRLVPDTGDELPSRQIAKRIRGVMAENMILGVQLAEAIGMDQASFSRRYSGKINWTFDEVARVADALGMTFVELVSSIDPPRAAGTPGTVDKAPPSTTPGYVQTAGTVVEFPQRPRLQLIYGGAA